MTGQWNAEEAGTDPRWGDDDELFADERSSSHPPDSLVTLRFLWDAVRRHRRLWLAVALLGLAAGSAVPVILPPASVSSAKILLTHRAGDDPVRAIETDVTLATTHSVAQRTIDQLGLTETPDELLNQYTATPLTDRVLEIAVSAPSSEQATKLAGALANIFLTFRRDQIALQEVPLRKDLATARTAVAEAEADVRAAGGDPRDPDPPPTPQATRLTRANEKQRFIEQQILDQQVAASRMSGSRLLDAAAPVPSSTRRVLAINIGSGLVAGLFLGVGFVIVRALVSDRLWRRQDIAGALGSRVGLSVGQPPRRWLSLPGVRRRSPTQMPEIQLVVRHLRDGVSWSQTPKPALAVVSIDNARSAALIVASLATSFAADGKRVLVADLSGSGALASAMGVTSTGTNESRRSDAGESVTVHLPAAESGPAEGPHLRLSGGSHSTDDDALDAAWAAADLVLTLATLSPALGGEHLRTWSSQATVVVTAGRSTAARIRAVGEMVRIAGLRLAPAVILRPDRTDDSVGVVEGEVPSATTGTGVEMIGR